MNDGSERGGFEQYRLMVISTWPESESKRVALASARAALEREAAFDQSGRAVNIDGHGTSPTPLTSTCHLHRETSRRPGAPT